MTETIVIHDSGGYHLRLHGIWHHGLTRDESRRLLLDAHIDDAYFLVESAPWWPDPAEVEYRPVGRRRWLVDGRPVTRDGAAWTFREAGMTHEQTSRFLRICRLCYEIEQRQRPPSNSMTVEEVGRLLTDGLAHALSLRVALHWVREHLRPARCRHPLGLSGWKQQFEHDKPKRCITQDEFIQSLKEAGILVLGDDVYCEEVTS